MFVVISDVISDDFHMRKSGRRGNLYIFSPLFSDTHSSTNS